MLAVTDSLLEIFRSILGSAGKSGRGSRESGTVTSYQGDAPRIPNLASSAPQAPEKTVKKVNQQESLLQTNV